MTTTDALVTDYLTRLNAAAAVLPPDRRAELLEGIGEHIDAARASGAAPDEAGVRTLLDRLGEPAEIVGAARDESPYGPSPVLRTPGTGLELAAVIMLTVGSFLPVVGWLVGVVLLWWSSRWRVGEKLLGTLVVPLGPGGALLLGGLAPFGTVEMCESGPNGQVVCTSDGAGLELGVLGPLLLLTTLVAPWIVAVLLLRRARQRAALEPGVPVRAGLPSPWGGLELSAVLILGLGGLVLPVVAVLVGLVLTALSPAWSRATKGCALALALVPMALVVGAFTGVVGGLPLGAFAAYLFLLVGPGIAATMLAVQLSRRGQQAADPRLASGQMGAMGHR